MRHEARSVSRRAFLTQAGLAGAALASRPLGTLGAPPKRPNILFLLTDDQRWDTMGCAGNAIIHTPEMDKLAAKGVRFLNSFVTTSICAAGRASVFTGLYERTHQFTFGTPPLRAELTDTSYPTLLRAAGYRTGFVGKFGVGVAKGAREKMFDSFKGLGRNPYFKKRADGSVRHLTDLTGDEAIKFLRSCKRDQPFCLSVSFNAPHAEDRDKRQYIWPKAMDALYRDAKIPVPKTADPAFFERHPEFIKKSLSRVRWHWRFETPEMAQRMTKGYYRMISGVDAVVGRIRAELERLGLADDTIVVLTGDNGYFVGERGFAGKWTGHEHSLRVPLIVCDPRAKAPLRGTTPKQMALNVDLAPTFLDLAGVPVPKPMQGRSLVPVLQGQSPAWRRDFFHEHLFDHGAIPKYEGVRTERWKYIRYFQQKPVYEELYDFVQDPWEEHNLVGDKRHAEALETLRKRCDELRDRYGGPFVPRPRRRRPRRAAAKLGIAGVAAGVKGRAAVFDGTCYLPIGKTPALGKDDAFSWSFWVKLDKASSRSGVVIGNRRLGPSDTVQFMKFTPETAQYFNTREHAIRLAHKVPAGKWVHVALVKAKGSFACYADGRKVASAPCDFDMPSLPLYLGGDPHAGELATCQLDEVRLYDRALSPADIAALRKLRAVEDALVGHWSLNEPPKPSRAKGK